VPINTYTNSESDFGECMNEMSFKQVLDLIQKEDPVFLDSILIDENSLEWSDYVYFDYKAVAVTRHAHLLRTPMWSSIANDISTILGGEVRHGEMAYLPSEKLVERLKENKGVRFLDLSETDDESRDRLHRLFKHPLELEGDGSLSLSPRRYFIPALTSVETCGDCEGKKYVKCADCPPGETHEWSCTGYLDASSGCGGKGRVVCSDCGGEGKVRCGTCRGATKVRCTDRCSSGQVTKTTRLKDGKFKHTKINCPTCRGSAKVKCPNCSGGRVVCRKCGGEKKLTCPACGGRKIEVCPKCYGGDRADLKYGKVDCQACFACGSHAQLVFVSSTISNHERKGVAALGKQFSNLDDDVISVCAADNYVRERAAENLTDDTKIFYDPVLEPIIQKNREHFSLHLSTFKKVATEDLYSKLLSCGCLRYTHILSQEQHEVFIVNAGDKPFLYLPTKPRDSALSNVLVNFRLQLSHLFGFLFRTKSFKDKKDGVLEIRLLLRLIRVDGNIGFSEKKLLVDKIIGLDNLTNKERRLLFDLLEIEVLPELEVADLAFSSQGKFDEVKINLERMARADGNVLDCEQELLQKIVFLRSKYLEKH
jgi:hypothetical protein